MVVWVRILYKKQNQDKYIILLENNQEIEIDNMIFFKYELNVKDDIDVNELEDILNQQILNHAKKQLLGYIKRYPLKSINEYIQYLERKGFDKATAQTAVAYFIEIGYIDEISSIKRIIGIYKNRKSSKEIVNILRKKGFSNQSMNEIINEVKSLEDEKLLEKLIKKRLSNKELKIDEKNIKKLIRYLTSKGFEYNQILRKIKDYLNS